MTKPARSKHRQQLGKLGEDAASAYLQRQGFRILTRNFRTRSGELDIVALDGVVLVFVEVKTRIGSAFGLPEEAVTPYKLRDILSAAAYYVAQHGGADRVQRVDVVALELNEDQTIRAIRHLRNASG